MNQPPDEAAVPDWAIQQARSALQGGMKAPEVEQRFVAVGLDPQMAHRAVARALGASASAPPPQVDGRLDYVRAALRMDVNVPEIEQALVKRGMAPEVAEALVTRVLGERVRGRQADTERHERRRALHRILSAVLACGCLGLAFWYAGPYSAVIALLWLALPLTCVWFADTDWFRRRFPQSSVASGVIARWLGWLLLVLYFLYRLELVVYKP